MEARHTNARVLGPHTATAQGELTHLLCKLLLHLHYLYSCLQCFDAVLGGRKGIWPVKKLSCGGAGMVICLERGADLHMAQLMPLPLTVSCFSKIQIGFSFLVLAHPVVPDKGPLNVCVYVCIHLNIQKIFRIFIRSCKVLRAGSASDAFH